MVQNQSSCRDRLFLQRVSGRDRFIHRLLQEHLAAMSLEKGEGQGARGEG